MSRKGTHCLSSSRMLPLHLIGTLFKYQAGNIPMTKITEVTLNHLLLVRQCLDQSKALKVTRLKSKVFRLEWLYPGRYIPSGSVGIPHRNCLNLTGNINQNFDNWTNPSCSWEFWTNYSPYTNKKPTQNIFLIIQLWAVL